MDRLGVGFLPEGIELLISFNDNATGHVDVGYVQALAYPLDSAADKTVIFISKMPGDFKDADGLKGQNRTAVCCSYSFNDMRVLCKNLIDNDQMLDLDSEGQEKLKMHYLMHGSFDDFVYD